MEETQEVPKDKFPEYETQMKILFQRLTEVILGGIQTGRDGLALIVAVGKWSALMIASIMVVIERDPGKSFELIDKFTNSLNHDIKRHLVMLRGFQKQNKPEEKKIITRDDIT